MQSGDKALPGTPRHQRVLAATVRHIAAQPWARALVLFGSLARGNWDEYSDLDLDVVIADDARVEPVAELERLCASFAALGERAAVIVPKRDDEGDVVLESLLGLSPCASIRLPLPAPTSSRACACSGAASLPKRSPPPAPRTDRL